MDLAGHGVINEGWFDHDPSGAHYEEQRKQWPRESTRFPKNIEERARNVFRSPRNIAYLSQLLHIPNDNVLMRRVHSFIPVTPVERPESITFWEIVRMYNRDFANSHLRMERQIDDYNSGVQDEPYHMQMFIADSLKPAALGDLNDMNQAPLHFLEEDRRYTINRNKRDYRWSKNKNASRGDQQIEGFAPLRRDHRFDLTTAFDAHDALMISENAADLSDAPWHGDEDAYGWFGPGSCPDCGMNQQVCRCHVDGMPAWKKETLCESREPVQTRFMRREKIPFYQHTSLARETVEADIEETLGLGDREHSSHIRRWWA